MDTGDVTDQPIQGAFWESKRIIPGIGTNSSN
jgi:hypothetical protein